MGKGNSFSLPLIQIGYLYRSGSPWDVHLPTKGINYQTSKHANFLLPLFVCKTISKLKKNNNNIKVDKVTDKMGWGKAVKIEEH